jgi:rubredoxin
MKFMPVYKCRRCGMVFSKGTTYDSKYHSPFRTELHEHICGDNQHGLADAVGFDEVPEEATS